MRNFIKTVGIVLMSVICLSKPNSLVQCNKNAKLNSFFKDGQRLDPSSKKIAPNRNDNGLDKLPVYNKDLEFNLLVTYWDKHDRLEDFKISFEKNIQNPFIKKIYIFYESFSGQRPSFLESEKVAIIPIAEIAHHKTFYEFANQNLLGQIVIMANADIYFDESLEKLKYIDFNIYNIALTRYNYYVSAWIPSSVCHDTWIFRAPIQYKEADYRFNRFGTEHLLVHDWVNNGYKVMNPCLSIFSYHVHKSDYRAPSVINNFKNHPIYLLPMETLLECLNSHKIFHTKPDCYDGIKPKKK